MTKRSHAGLDLFYLGVVLLVLLGLPVLIWSYDHHYWQTQALGETKVFTLTGHTTKGWVLGDIKAHDVATTSAADQRLHNPEIHVRKGDRVLLKLKSSDVIHGFSMKDAGIFITDGIHPGKVTLVSFNADREGIFSFSCNAICGDNHKTMQGRIIVSA